MSETTNEPSKVVKVRVLWDREGLNITSRAEVNSRSLVTRSRYSYPPIACFNYKGFRNSDPAVLG